MRSLVVAAASLFVAVTALPASASLVYVDLSPGTNVPTGFYQPYSPFSTTSYDFSLNNYNDNTNGGTYQQVYISFAPGTVATNGSFTTNSFAEAKKLAAGTVVNSALLSGPHSYNPLLASQHFGQGDFYSATAPVTGYIGFSIPDNGGLTHYAWAQVRVSPTGGGTLDVLGYAYDSVANTAVTVGVTPEPVSIAALAMGGLLLGRRRRA